MIDCRDKLDNHGFIIEDGGFPDLLRDGLKKLPGGIASGQRWIRWLRDVFRTLGGPSSSRARLAETIFNLLDFETVRDALPYLVMGMDAADGVMEVDPEGNLQITWPHSRSLPFFREIEATLREVTQCSSPGLDGNLMLNPTWSAQKQLVTVHPLGGCPMGDDISKGVVSPEGEVFNYPNLYVTDGSIVPSAVGPNPSKTIGALAERVSEHIIRRGI